MASLIELFKDEGDYRDERGLAGKVAFTPEEARENREYETSPEVEASLRRAIVGERDPKKRAILEDSYQADFGRPSGVGSDALFSGSLRKTAARVEPMEPAADRGMSILNAIDRDDGAVPRMEEFTDSRPNAGFASDTGTLLKMGVKNLAADVTGVLAQVPGLKDIPGGGGTKLFRNAEEYWAESQKKDRKDLSLETDAALDKKWWDDGPGEALKDWRSWYAGALISLPETAASMIPAMRMAKGAAALAEARALANATKAGLSAKAAQMAVAKAGSRAASTAAYLTGAVTEGSMGGAAAARAVREEIMAMPADVLAKSHAYQSLVDQGMSDAEARAQLTEDADTKAFLLGGVATGLFSGAGDVMLAKMLRGEIKGGLLKKMAVGGVSEGLLEEFPQSGLTKMGENVALQQADPARPVTQGAANEAVGGLAVGGLMGVGFGAGGHVMWRDAPSTPGQRELEDAAGGTPPGEPPQAGAPAADDGLAGMHAAARRDLNTAGRSRDAMDVAFDPNPENDLAKERAAIEALAAAQKLAAELEPGDVVKKDGSPFRTRQIAALVQKNRGLDNLEVVQVTGGFVLRETRAAEQSQEQTGGAPVAESLAPAPEAGEDSLATILEPAGPDLAQGETDDLQGNAQVDAAQGQPEGAQIPVGGEGLAGAAADVSAEIPGAVAADQISGVAQSTANTAEQAAPSGKQGPIPEKSLTADLAKMRKQVAGKESGAITDFITQNAAGRHVLKSPPPDGMREAVIAEIDRRNSTPTLDAAAHEAATSPQNDLPQPTKGQIEAGNYKKGKLRLHGLDISIENPKGSIRSGTAPDGRRWETTMASHYGYFRNTRGRDKDHVDVFLTDGAEKTGQAWVIDQIDPKTGKFDEHKVLIGPNGETAARKAYLANHEKGWKGLGAITRMPMEEFKAWVSDEAKTRRPVAYTAPQKEVSAEPVEASSGAVAQEPGENKSGNPVPLESIVVNIKAQVAESGETVAIRDSAKTALSDVDNRLDFAKRLLECLAS